MQGFQLLQITDPHLFGDATRELNGLNTAEWLRLVLAAALGQDRRPDAIVVTGDIGGEPRAEDETRR